MLSHYSAGTSVMAAFVEIVFDNSDGNVSRILLEDTQMQTDHVVVLEQVVYLSTGMK